MARRRNRSATAGRMKILVDMNLSPLWVSFLAAKGFTAVHWSTVGQPWAADSEIFDFAAANARFGFRYATGRVTDKKAQCHVIQVRTQDVLRSAIGDIVLRAIQTANQTSKPALSLPWALFVTAFGCCPSERIADPPATPVPTDLSANCSEPQAGLRDLFS
jgi:predicted nuclease of predicted toxin-antitoxin system